MVMGRLRRSRALRVLTLCAFLAAQVMPAFANPEGATIVAGTVTIDQSSATITQVNQSSQKAIVNWSSFSNKAGETVNFNQQMGRDSATLNRVTGSSASNIHGAINAPGHVLLLNPNGVLIGRTANVNVGALTVSTLDMKNEDFMAGRYHLKQDPTKPLRSVVNQGTIKTAPGGHVALVAPIVSNEGTIEAPQGRVALAAGTDVTVNVGGGDLITVAAKVGKPGDVVMPEEAAGEVLRSIVRNTDVVESGSVSVKNGVVTLGGAEGVAVNAGVITAPGAAGERAGTVDVRGTQAAVAAPESLIAANGFGSNSSGGEIRILSPGTAVVAKTAKLEARGGDSGDGGFIEVSGKQHVMMEGLADTRATKGKTGTFLIDPANLKIVDKNDPVGVDQISESVLEAQLSDISLEADNSITLGSLRTDGVLRLQPNVSLSMKAGAGGIRFENTSNTIETQELGGIHLTTGYYDSVPIRVGSLRSHDGDIIIDKSPLLNYSGTLSFTSISTQGGTVRLNVGGGNISGGEILSGGSIDISKSDDGDLTFGRLTAKSAVTVGAGNSKSNIAYSSISAGHGVGLFTQGAVTGGDITSGKGTIPGYPYGISIVGCDGIHVGHLTGGDPVLLSAGSRNTNAEIQFDSIVAHRGVRILLDLSARVTGGDISVDSPLPAELNFGLSHNPAVFIQGRRATWAGASENIGDVHLGDVTANGDVLIANTETSWARARATAGDVQIGALRASGAVTIGTARALGSDSVATVAGVTIREIDAGGSLSIGTAAATGQNARATVGNIWLGDVAAADVTVGEARTSGVGASTAQVGNITFSSITSPGAVRVGYAEDGAGSGSQARVGDIWGGDVDVSGSSPVSIGNALAGWGAGSSAHVGNITLVSVVANGAVVDGANIGHLFDPGLNKVSIGNAVAWGNSSVADVGDITLGSIVATGWIDVGNGQSVGESSRVKIGDISISSVDAGKQVRIGNANPDSYYSSSGGYSGHGSSVTIGSIALGPVTAGDGELVGVSNDAQRYGSAVVIGSVSRWDYIAPPRRPPLPPTQSDPEAVVPPVVQPGDPVVNPPPVTVEPPPQDNVQPPVVEPPPSTIPPPPPPPDTGPDITVDYLNKIDGYCSASAVTLALAQFHLADASDATRDKIVETLKDMKNLQLLENEKGQWFWTLVSTKQYKTQEALAKVATDNGLTISKKMPIFSKSVTAVENELKANHTVVMSVHSYASPTAADVGHFIVIAKYDPERGFLIKDSAPKRYTDTADGKRELRNGPEYWWDRATLEKNIKHGGFGISN